MNRRPPISTLFPYPTLSRSPERVRSLTLSEPPVLPWVEGQPGGDALVQDFFQRCWIPVGRALARQEPVEALAIAAKYFTGHSGLPPAACAPFETQIQGVGGLVDPRHT